MLDGIFDGFMGIFHAFRLLGSRKMFKYIMIAGIFGLLVGLTLGTLIYYQYANMGAWLFNLYPFEWGSSFFETVSRWMALLIALFLLVFSFKYIVIILLSPILSYISEITEEHITGIKSKPFNLERLLMEIARSIRINLRNIYKELFYTFLLIILGLFTGLGFITAPLIIVVQAYFMGFSNLDFLLERHYNYKTSLKFVGNYKMLAIGNGLGFLLLFAIPVLGFILAPTLSVIGATVEGIERMDEFDDWMDE